ncbi:MAG: hypothetical protein H6765_06060 [Candidatus Peribacteria bacterium]|nr:MAG: hypothetical protein H6765_06060 [Candidatus Peribacteria bacterium]
MAFMMLQSAEQQAAAALNEAQQEAVATQAKEFLVRYDTEVQLDRLKAVVKGTAEVVSATNAYGLDLEENKRIKQEKKSFSKEEKALDRKNDFTEAMLLKELDYLAELTENATLT